MTKKIIEDQEEKNESRTSRVIIIDQVPKRIENES